MILKPGSTWAGCEIVRLVGSGGFAEVYEVRDRSGSRRALKILNAESDVASMLHVRLAQEGEALALVEHVNVLRFYDSGIQDDRVWLLLEFVEGKSLRELEDACGGRLPLESVLRWTRQACEGLAAAHAQGVIHRDVKPENILVTSADVVKVIDFGLAKLPAPGVKTTQHRVMGTAFYMAPEQLRSTPVDARADVYAMGHVLYEAVAGVHALAQPGRPLTLMTVLVRQLTYTPLPLIVVVPEIPAELSDLVQRALAKDPVHRVQTMSDVAARLHEILVGLLVRRRNAARDLVLRGREIGLQRTLPTRAWVEAPLTAHPTLLIEAVDTAAPAAQRTSAPSSTVEEPSSAHMTGDRAAIVPPPPAVRGHRRVIAMVVLLSLCLGLALFGVLALRDRPYVPPMPRRRPLPPSGRDGGVRRVHERGCSVKPPLPPACPPNGPHGAPPSTR
jgi:serine/threonine-protein kinase